MTMRTCSTLLISAFSLLAISVSVAQNAHRYSSVRIDDMGQLHIMTEEGREITPLRTASQVSFGSPALSPDRRTVGWLVEYDSSKLLGVPYDPIAGELVLYKNGRIVHRFDADPVIWDWKFVNGGSRIAYTIGPLHGNPSGCVLRDAFSGRVIKRWFYDENAELPDWATGIRCDGV
jgi:hypothetical protein